jgi:putative ABC transport system permease protein
MILIRLALRGLMRRRSISAATALLVLVAVAANLSVVQLQRGVEAAVAAGQERLGADIQVVPRASDEEVERAIYEGHGSRQFLDVSVAGALAHVSGVEEVIPTLVLPTAPHCCGLDIKHNVIGVPLERLRWIGSDPKLTASDTVVGSDVEGVELGEPVRIYSQKFRVTRVLPATGTALDRALYVELSTARTHGGKELGLHLAEGAVSTIELRVAPGYDLSLLATEIERTVPQVQAVTSTQLFRSARVLLDQLRIVGVAAAVVTSLLGVVAISAISLLVGRARRRELGIVRALGARRGQIFALVVIEMAFNAAIGAVLGAVLAVVGVIALERTLAESLPFLLASPSWTVRAGTFAVLVATVIGALASVAAATQAARLDPFDALRERA